MSLLLLDFGCSRILVAVATATANPEDFRLAFATLSREDSPQGEGQCDQIWRNFATWTNFQMSKANF